MLSYEEAKRTFDYDPETGVIRWVKSGSGITVGSVAGNSTKRYVWIKYHGRYLAGHKVAWLLSYGEWPSHVVDHVNGVTTDNRISNLRRASVVENIRNRQVRSDNASGFKGIQKRGPNKWRARIFLSGKSVHLGFFESAEAAHGAYVKAAKEHFGDFANTGTGPA